MRDLSTLKCIVTLYEKNQVNEIKTLFEARTNFADVFTKGID
jgi:hypothetical protein